MLFVGALMLPLLMAIGVHAFWPMLKQECERREWWEVAWSYAGDAVAGFWYVWFVGGYLFGPERLPSGMTVASRPGAGIGWRRVAISMLVGAVIDAGASAWVFHSEYAGYRDGIATTARGRASRRSFPEVDHYRIVCEFTDGRGLPHSFWVVAVDGRGHRPPTGYPPELVNALRRGLKELPVKIRYDPQHPQRAWIEGSGGVDENGYPWASLCVLGFQTGCLLVFALIFLPRLYAEAKRGVIPWWSDIHRVAPLAFEAICVGGCGILEMFVGRM